MDGWWRREVALLKAWPGVWGFLSSVITRVASSYPLAFECLHVFDPDCDSFVGGFRVKAVKECANYLPSQGSSVQAMPSRGMLPSEGCKIHMIISRLIHTDCEDNLRIRREEEQNTELFPPHINALAALATSQPARPYFTQATYARTNHFLMRWQLMHGHGLVGQVRKGDPCYGDKRVVIGWVGGEDGDV